MSTPTDTTNEPSDTTTVDDDETLDELFNHLVTYNYFVYSYTELRYVVRRHDAGVDDRRKCVQPNVLVDEEDQCSNDEKKASSSSSSWWKFWASDTILDQVEFYRPELIITDKASIQKMNRHRNLLHPVTAAAVKSFVEENRKYLVSCSVNGNYGELQFNTDWRNFGEPVQGWFGRTSEYTHDKETEKERLWFQQKLQEQVETGTEIIDYDDTYLVGDNEGLVYSLIVNKTKKCLCVVFRGTVGNKIDGFGLGTMWESNLDFELSDAGEYGNGALIHKGFGEYLFGTRGCDEENHTYLHRIIASINDAYQHNADVSSDYKLFISGHSLGGALASLCGFHLARLKERNDESVQYLPKKMKVVTFAAPMTGNAEYNVQYQRLEEQGFLRHLRITNEGDFVPTPPPNIPFVISGDPSQFVHTGVNLVLSSNAKSYINNNNVTTFRSQLSLKPGTYHSLPEFENRWGPYNPANPANPRKGTPDYNQDFRPLTLKQFYEKGGDDVSD